MCVVDVCVVEGWWVVVRLLVLQTSGDVRQVSQSSTCLVNVYSVTVVPCSCCHMSHGGVVSSRVELPLPTVPLFYNDCGQVVHTDVSLTPCSRIWYQPNCVDARWPPTIRGQHGSFRFND